MTAYLVGELLQRSDRTWYVYHCFIASEWPLTVTHTSSPRVLIAQVGGVDFATADANMRRLVASAFYLAWVRPLLPSAR